MQFSPDEYQTAESLYLCLVVETLEADVRRALGTLIVPPNAPDLRLQSLALYSLETYWEFLCDDATALLERLTPALRMHWQAVRERTHGIDENTESNAKSIRLFLSNGVSVRVYAKRSNRLRIEVEHKPAKSSRLLSRYSADSTSGLLKMIGKLRVKAAETVNDLLEFLSEWAEETPTERAHSVLFLSRWFQRMGYGPSSKRLLSLLMSNGRICSRAGLDPWEKRALLNAKRRSLLFCLKGAFFPRHSDESDGNSKPIRHTVLRNGIYHFRMRIPAAVRETGEFGSKKEITESLETSDPIEAARRVSECERQWNSRFKLLH